MSPHVAQTSIQYAVADKHAVAGFERPSPSALRPCALAFLDRAHGKRPQLAAQLLWSCKAAVQPCTNLAPMCMSCSMQLLTWHMHVRVHASPHIKRHNTLSKTTYRQTGRMCSQLTLNAKISRTVSTRTPCARSWLRNSACCDLALSMLIGRSYREPLG